MQRGIFVMGLSALVLMLACSRQQAITPDSLNPAPPPKNAPSDSGTTVPQDVAPAPSPNPDDSSMPLPDKNNRTPK